MSHQVLVYLIFGIVLGLGLLFDLGLMSKKNTVVPMRIAFLQTLFWVGISLAFFGFMWHQEGRDIALEYLSAYLMEWSLSIDNIFVFILIFASFGISEKYYGRALLIGIMMAIVFRILFITVGVALVEKFHFLLYIFGVFLIYTGYKMFTAKKDEGFNPQESNVYKWMQKYLPLTASDGGGKFIIIENGKRVYTMLFVVIIMLATIDLVFALDSIPAVMGISKNSLVIYTSNIFAVLGLRSMFFLLKGAVNRFQYLQHGIAIVLVFIGIKMLLEQYLNEIMTKNTQVILSLSMIVICIGGAMLYSNQKREK